MIIYRCDRHPGEGRGPEPKQRTFGSGWITAFAGMTMLASGCSGSSPSDDPLLCESSPDVSDPGSSVLSPENQRQVGIFGISDARRLRKKSVTTSFGTGFLSDTVSSIGGTGAKTVAIKVKVLRTHVANQRALEVARASGGKSALPSRSGWACKILADSVSSLDTRQSDEQFQESLTEVEQYFIRLYQANGGTDVESDLKNLTSPAGQNE